MDVVLLKKEEYKIYMINLSYLDTFITPEKNWYGSFLIEPLDIGQGTTVGNTIRRILLSNFTGFSITGVRINNLKHEFSVIEGIREDTLEVLLNLKNIIFQSCFSKKEKNIKSKGFLCIQGPSIITAGMFQLPKNQLMIINPSQYICTLSTNTEIYMEIDIDNNIGYNFTEDNQQKFVDSNKVTTLVLNSLYIPIKKVNFKIKLIHDSYGNLKESLFLEIVTNGSLSPKRSLQEAIKLILNLFYPLLINSNVLSLY
jgi:DNA-directed RNA polymerase subunit alpha